MLSHIDMLSDKLGMAIKNSLALPEDGYKHKPVPILSAQSTVLPMVYT